MVVIGINIRRASARMDEQGVANEGAQDNQVYPLKEVATGDQVLIAPPLIADVDVREAFLKWSKLL